MEGIDRMTKEHRILFLLSDLKNLRLVCRQCEGEILYPIYADQRIHPPDHCAHCNAHLGMVRGVNSVIGEFLTAMQKVMANDESLKVGIKFEIDDESN